MPGVLPVQPRVGSLLSQVAEGSQIASNLYGIKQKSDAADLAQQAADRQQQQFEDEQAGKLTPLQRVALSHYGTVESQPDVGPPNMKSGSSLLQFVGDQNKSVFTPFKEGQLVKGVDPVTGGPVWEYATRDHSVPAYEPPREAKTPTPHITPLGQDADGNMVTLDTTTGHTNTVPMGGPLTKVGGKGTDPAKEAKDNEKTYGEIGGKLVTFKGNKAVNQANLNMLFADTALGLANKYQGNYNNMDPNDYQLFVGELAKMAQGGVGSQHTQEALTANTLQSKWAKFKQEIGGEPTGAQLGSFIQNNVDYLKEIEKVSAKHVGDFQSVMWKSNKNRLPADLQARFTAEFSDQPLFRGQNAADLAAQAHQMVGQGGGFVGTANAAPTLAPTKSGYMPGTVLDIDGVHYRVSDDGKTAIPVGGR